MAKEMAVKLIINIGLPDARELELPSAKEGDEISVSFKVAETLIRNGWAEPVGDSSESRSFRGVPRVDATTEPTKGPGRPRKI